MFFIKVPLIGIDLGADSVKLACLKDKKGLKELILADIVKLPPDTIVEGEIIDSNAIIEVLKDLSKTYKLKKTNVATCVSGSSVVIKKVKFPVMSKEELRESIRWEATQYIPFDIEEVNIDFHIFPYEEGAETMEVMLVVVKKDKIELLSNILLEADFIPKIVDVDLIAIQNQFEFNYGIDYESTIALVDIGAEITNINIIKGENSLFTRNVPIGGKYFSKELQKSLGVSFEEAEKLKLEDKESENLKKIKMEFLNLVSAEISRSLEFFKFTIEDTPISKIYLSGGCSKISEIDKILYEKTKIPVEIMDPFKNIYINPKKVDVDFIKSNASLLPTVIGLALRRI